MYQISKNHIAVPPGETIKEQLEIWEITKAEFLSRMGILNSRSVSCIF